MVNPSLSTKSRRTRQRKSIILVLFTMIVLTVVAGIGGGDYITDNTVYKATAGETIVAELAPPETGTPEDHDALSSLKYAAYKLHHATYFRGETDGVAVADIGFTTYEQHLRNTRVVKGENTVFAETVSSSSLKNLGEQKYAEDGIIVYRPSVSVKNGVAKFSDTAYRMTYEAYADSYGTIPNQLSKYIINEETILSVVDENAVSAAPKNAPRVISDGENSGGIEYLVPQGLTPDANGHYKFTLTLDPETSTRYYRNEMRTLAGSDKHPKFYSARVTVEIDGEWNPVRVTTVENYDIAIPVLGAMNCTGTNVETFYQINDPSGEIPEREFFAQYIDEAKLDPDYVPPPPPPPTVTSPADYLAAAFAPYLSGEKELALEAEVVTDALTLYDLTVVANLATLEVQAKYDDLYVKYAGDKVYLRLNKLNGYIRTEKFKELMQADELASLLAGLGDLSALDPTALFGGDILGTVFAECEMTAENGVARIHMPFTVDLAPLGMDAEAKIDASIYINDEDKSLHSITASVDVAGISVGISAKPPRRTPRFPSTDGAVDISSILDFVPDVMTTAKQRVFGISGTVSAVGYDVEIDGYVDITDGIEIDATLGIAGLDIGVTYKDEILFLTLGSITVRGTADELPELIDAIKPLLGDTGDLSGILKTLKSLLPTTVEDYLGVIKNVTVTDDTLRAELSLLTVPVTVEATRANGRISGVKLALDVDMFGIEFDAAVDLKITAPERREVVHPRSNGFITFSQLATLITELTPYLSATCFDVELEAEISANGTDYAVAASLAADISNGIAATGTVDVFGQSIQATFVDGILYAAVGNIRVALDTSKLDALTSPLERIFTMPELPELDVATLLGCIKSLYIDERGTLVATFEYGDARIIAAVDFETGYFDLNCRYLDYRLNVDATVKIADARTVTSPQGDYVMLDGLGGTLDAALDILLEKSLTANATVTAAGFSVALDVELSFANGIALRVTAADYGIQATLLGDKLFVSLGDIRVTCALSELPDILEKLGDIVPDDISQTVNGIMSKFGGKPNIAAVVKTVVAAVSSFTASDADIGLGVGFGGVSAQITVSPDLSALTATADIDGTQATVELTSITARKTDIAVDGEYAKLSDLATIAAPIVPLANGKAFDITVDAEMFGTTIGGNVYICAGEQLAVNAQLTAGDVPVGITVLGDMLYLSVANSLHIKEQISEASVLAAADKLDYALPGIKATVEQVIEQFKTMTLRKFLSCLALSPIDNGCLLVLDMTDIGMDVHVEFAFDTAGGSFNALSVSCDISGTQFGAALSAVVDDGTLAGFDAIPEENGLFDALAIKIAPAAEAAVTVADAYYIPLSDITRLIAPLCDLVADAKTAKSLTLDLSAELTTSDNAHTAVKGTATVSLDPLAVDATLTLFYGTDDAVDIALRYTDNVVYVKVGNIALSLDTATDFKRLYDVLAEYLPEYINTEIAKLLGIEKGASAFSDISLIADRFAELATAADTGAAIKLLFKPLDGMKNDSALKTLLETVSVFERSGKLAVGIDVFGITLNLTPEFDAEYAELTGAKLDTDVAGLTVALAVNSYALSASSAQIGAPETDAEYVSVIEFVEAVNNAVHTFTQTDADGNITFEVKTFSFDYLIFDVETTTDEAGNTVTVKDEAGRDKPRVDEAGNKIVAKTVKVKNKENFSALKGKLIRDEVTDENGKTSVSYRFNLEAHIVLDIDSLKNSTPLTLDLYVVNTDGNGIAFLDYKENNGFGERISIDYTSIMQIVAAVLDIMGMDDEVTELLVGDYRLDIDKTVFESMDIAGLDTVRQLLANIVDAARRAGEAIDSAKAGWDLIATAGSIDGLKARLDDIKAKLGTAISELKAAIAVFQSTDDADAADGKTPEATEINGKLFKQIVNGVTLKKDATHIQATIENEITTNTPGISSVTVTQNAGKIERIKVGGLDVNTAKLNDFDAQFTAGGDVTVALPDGYNTTQGNSTYSDFSNIKHLLFDVMNTANMLEFDIGGLDTSDSISVHMSLGADWLANIVLKVKYDAKVKIIKVGENANGKPVYKTAAAIEIRNEKAQLQILGIGSKIIVPECVTRLYFYDNVLYVQGISSWQTSAQRVVGDITDITCIADVWGGKQTRYPTVKNRAYKQETSYNMNYVNVMYTVDELFWMMQNDMSRFLNEFLFYLIPITTEKIAGQDIRGLIDSNIGGSSGSSEAPQKTVAQVFKGYTYKAGAHALTIGLAELTGSSSLSDLNISLVGMNDGDDNITDNYISSLNINTSIAGIINVNLDATLRNVNVTSTGLKSKGLAPTNVSQVDGKYSANGKNYVLECLNYDRNTIYTLDGLTYLTANGNELYTENGSFAPALCATDRSDTFVWTTTFADSAYCDSVYKFGDTGATYYYTTSLEGHGYRVESDRDVYYIGTDSDGSRYVYRLQNGNRVRVAVKSITGSFLAEVTRDADGKIISVVNRAGGASWNRIWQAAYESAL